MKVIGVRARRGFTLIEVLLALGLCALISGLWVAGAGNLMRSADVSDPEDQLLSALQRARRHAVEIGQTVDVRILEEGSQLTWGDLPTQTRTITLTETLRARLVGAETEGLILLGGTAEAPPLARLRFYADGTCDRARLEVRRLGQTTYRDLDPLTAALLPTPKR